MATKRTTETEIVALRERLAILDGTHPDFHIRRVDDPDFPDEDEDYDNAARWVAEFNGRGERETLNKSKGGDWHWTPHVAVLFKSAAEAFAALDKVRS